MSSHLEWQTIYDFWFPRDLPTADASKQWQMLEWWMRGGANAELPQFTSFVQAARSGHLEHWLDTPHGRLSLVIVLDQFPEVCLPARLRPTHPTLTPCGLSRRAFATAITTL